MFNPPPPHFKKVRSRSGPTISAIGWALLSQTIWLPLLAIDAHDRWQSRVRDLKPEVASLNPPTETEAAEGNTHAGWRSGSGSLLASINRDQDPLLDLGVDRSVDVGSGPGSPHAGSAPARPLASSAKPPSQAQGSRSDRLTGSSIPGRANQPQRPGPTQAIVISPPINNRSFGLSERSTAASSQLAFSRSSSRTSDNDPLASLPSAWREPMRKALQQLPAGERGSSSVKAARVIYVPSNRITSPATVPLALQPEIGRAHV